MEVTNVSHVKLKKSKIELLRFPLTAIAELWGDTIDEYLQSAVVMQGLQPDIDSYYETD
jgi:hypothetical protein